MEGRAWKQSAPAAAMAPLCAVPITSSLLTRNPPAPISSPRALSLPGDQINVFDWAKSEKPRHRETQTGRMTNASALKQIMSLSALQRSLNTMQRDRKAFGANQMGQRERRTAVPKPMPRSSSPVSTYVDFPCIIDQAFTTIAWEDLESCPSVVRQEGDSLSCQLKESDSDDQYFGDYMLDFIADSTATHEDRLSPAELVPFQGCVIPPLTPQREFSPEDTEGHSLTESSNFHPQDGASWRGMVACHEMELGRTMAINKQLHETLQRQQHELDSLEERNHHLRQLASRAKHLASVLEKLMTVRDSEVEPVVPCSEKASLGSCKRQRLDEGYETESSDSVEDMLRDISTRCNAVLLSNAAGPTQQQESEMIRMYGAFSGLQMSTLKDNTATVDGAEAGDSVSSFRTSVREHCTIRTQVFPHGHAFTSRTQQGGYRFRWVPSHS